MLLTIQSKPIWTKGRSYDAFPGKLKKYEEMNLLELKVRHLTV